MNFILLSLRKKKKKTFTWFNSLPGSGNSPGNLRTFGNQFTINLTNQLRIFSEFKEFAMKGNVVDLAAAVIIGAAFGKIVNFLIEDVTPLVLKPAPRCSTFV